MRLHDPLGALLALTLVAGAGAAVGFALWADRGRRAAENTRAEAEAGAGAKRFSPRYRRLLQLAAGEF